ncbi:PDZ domain-containing protein [Gorillibacterium massiliense]|uniref:YlbL family protein n=1 Tax=Gorillibacterium massiliense TaxID=1280390 RepID=UPI0004AE6AE1|nr:PDZ domain-containing protein [Gorillibacterium massiliense]
MSQLEGRFFRRGSKAWKVVIAFLLGGVAAYFLFFVPMPYYIYQPGSAEAVLPMVKTTSQGTAEEKGAFLLTTVGVLEPNAAAYIWAKWNHEEIKEKKTVLNKGETDEEYDQRQVYSMITSQSSALEAAYAHLKLPYKIKTDGIMVMHLVEGMPAKDVLRVGDYLLEVDGQVLQSADQLIQYLSGKKAGDSVEIKFRRGTDVHTAKIALGTLPQESPSPGASPAPPRSGIGITPALMQSIRSDDPTKQVSIDAGEIGGPSAGLMFTLEIINQLIPEDLTKGYRIAGTGTIDKDGNVGVIGGIQYKVTAADREHAEIFFAPKDLYLEGDQKIRSDSELYNGERPSEKNRHRHEDRACRYSC